MRDNGAFPGGTACCIEVEEVETGSKVILLKSDMQDDGETGSCSCCWCWYCCPVTCAAPPGSVTAEREGSGCARNSVLGTTVGDGWLASAAGRGGRRREVAVEAAARDDCDNEVKTVTEDAGAYVVGMGDGEARATVRRTGDTEARGARTGDTDRCGARHSCRNCTLGYAGPTAVQCGAPDIPAGNLCELELKEDAPLATTWDIDRSRDRDVFRSEVATELLEDSSATAGQGARGTLPIRELHDMPGVDVCRNTWFPNCSGGGGKLARRLTKGAFCRAATNHAGAASAGTAAPCWAFPGWDFFCGLLSGF